LAQEVKDYNINVNAILPSIIDTPTNRKDMPKANYSEWVTPQEIADVIYSLVSPWGKSIHGSLIPVTGRL
jgi:NAD(P)-dependent dehydrogenase (short-subunit alcohol dehydrogenase family)